MLQEKSECLAELFAKLFGLHANLLFKKPMICQAMQAQFKKHGFTTSQSKKAATTESKKLHILLKAFRSMIRETLPDHFLEATGMGAAQLLASHTAASSAEAGGPDDAERTPVKASGTPAESSASTPGKKSVASTPVKSTAKAKAKEAKPKAKAGAKSKAKSKAKASASKANTDSDSSSSDDLDEHDDEAADSFSSDDEIDPDLKAIRVLALRFRSRIKQHLRLTFPLIDRSCVAIFCWVHVIIAF